MTLVFFTNMFGRVLLLRRMKLWHFKGIQLSIQSLRCFSSEYTNVYTRIQFLYSNMLVLHFLPPPIRQWPGDSNRWDLGVLGWEASVRSLSLIIDDDTWRMTCEVIWLQILSLIVWLGGGFKYVLFSPLPGEMIQFDYYFSNGLKPPTSWGFLCNMFPSNWRSVKS